MPCPPPGDLPNPGMETRSPAFQVDSLSSEPPGKHSVPWSLTNEIGDFCRAPIIQENALLMAILTKALHQPPPSPATFFPLFTPFLCHHYHQSLSSEQKIQQQPVYPSQVKELEVFSFLIRQQKSDNLPRPSSPLSLYLKKYTWLSSSHHSLVQSFVKNKGKNS